MVPIAHIISRYPEIRHVPVGQVVALSGCILNIYGICKGNDICPR